MAEGECGPAFCSTRMSSAVDVELGIVDARGEILQRREHHRPALVLEQSASAAERLRMAPCGARLPNSATSPPCGSSGFLRSAMMLRSTYDSASPALRRSPSVSPVTVMASRCKQVLQFAQQRAHAAGGEEILHVAVADRLQVHQHRRRVGQFVELLQRDRQAGAAGDGREMDHRVGRAADGEQNAQRVLDRLLVDDLVRRQLGADQLDRGGAGRLRRAQAVGMHGGNGGGAGQ